MEGQQFLHQMIASIPWVQYAFSSFMNAILICWYLILNILNFATLLKDLLCVFILILPFFVFRKFNLHLGFPAFTAGLISLLNINHCHLAETLLQSINITSLLTKGLWFHATLDIYYCTDILCLIIAGDITHIILHTM